MLIEFMNFTAVEISDLKLMIRTCGESFENGGKFKHFECETLYSYL